MYNSNASPNIDNCNTYVNGVTIIYGSNPCKHIWTYADGLSEGNANFYLAGLSCPCNSNSFDTTIPRFVGNDYYCKSAIRPGQAHKLILYSNDILWDGQQCGGLEGP